MMKWLSRWSSLLLCFTIIVTSCNPSGNNDESNEDNQPPAPATPIVGATIISPTSTVLYLQLDEVRLTPKAENHQLYLSTVALVPMDIAGQTTMDARFEYFAGDELFELTRESPYQPTTPWFIGVEREALEQQDFGIWFIVTGASVDEPPDDNWQIARNTFMEVARDVAPLAIGGLAFLTLSMVTPGVPDEALAVGATMEGGTNLLGTMMTYGYQALPLLRNGLISYAGNQTRQLTEQQLDRLLEGVDAQGYVSEAFVQFFAAQNYLINQQIAVTTSDGSLEIVFSIVETSSEPEVVDALSKIERQTTKLSQEACNPTQESPVISGNRLKLQTTVVAAQDIFSTERTPAFNLATGDEVMAILSYCDKNNDVLWWRVRNEFDEVGWIQEGNGTFEVVRG